MTREHLPNRRKSVTFSLECEGHRYSSTVGFFRDGRLGEIFLDAGRPNTALQSNAENCAILASLALQNHVSVDTILHSITGPIAMALEIARTL